MAKYHDLRPTSPDSLLKKLKGEVVNKQTIPHGVKVARPYEATIYEDSSGGQWRWDGDARAELNFRLAAGEARIAEAEANLEQAQADLREARQRIGDATVSLGEYDSRVAAAESELAAAKSAQESLNTRLGSTETDLSELTRGVEDGTAIGDGVVTGAKVVPESVAAAVGQFVKVQAENVEVTGELVARVVNSMDTTTKRLVVNEETLLNHATLLGDTVVERINITGGLVGRDAILTGTVDVGQLNVTGDMSAEIVRAMTTETKELVVSEEAILKRATVIENIVTPELVAERVNSALVTGEILQTSPEANTGVKISNTGYRAWDETGLLTVNLDGKNNLMVGDFATSTGDKSGVSIKHTSTLAGIELRTPNWGGDTRVPTSHGAIWYSVPSALSARGLNIFATDKAAVQDTDPGIMLQPGASSIEFQGRFGTTGNAFKRGVYEGTSAPANGWWTIEVKFAEAMFSDPAIFISPVTESGVECAVGIQYANRFGFKAVVVNKSPRASGYAWLKWIALAI